MVRGLSFSPAGDAALARSWLEVSNRQDEQNSQSFWENVQEVFLKNFGISTDISTPESLRSRWNTLQRVVQKYLSCERACNAKPVSGETVEDAAVNIMRLFCNRTKKKDAYGVYRDGPPLHSLQAVEILRGCPKFSGITFVSKTEHKGDLCVSVEQKSANSSRTFNANIKQEHTPQGVKIKKRIDKAANISTGINSLASAMHDKNNVKKKELRLKCISSLPDGAVKTTLLLKFLKCENDEKANEVLQVDKNNSNDLNSKKPMSIVDLLQNAKESDKLLHSQRRPLMFY